MGFRESFAAVFRQTGGWDRFSERFAKYIGVRYAIPAPSGRVALEAIVAGLGLPAGGEVILPSLIFHPLPAAFRRAGLVPRFADIDPRTYCIDPVRAEAAVTENTVGIVAVHQYGRSCDMASLRRLADRRGLALIEDCAQACGASFAGRRVGGFGDGALFSFYPSKNLSALWAGMATTDSQRVADAARAHMESFGRIGRPALARRLVSAWAMRAATASAPWTAIGAPFLRACDRWNFDPVAWLTDETPDGEDAPDPDAMRMPRPFQAELAIGQLAALDGANRLRIARGDRLTELLSGAPNIEVSPKASVGENVYVSFVVRVRDRAAFRRGMLARGVDTHAGNMFVGPDLPGCDSAGDAKAARDAVRRMVHLPIYPDLSEADVDRIAAAAIAASAD